jgi:cytochrome c oxidase cbb3-type subunit III
MKYRAILPSLVPFAVLLCASCNGSPGRPGPDSTIVRPSEILGFDVLYSQNCAACHGIAGKGSAANALADPIFLAIADDTEILHVTANGTPGTPMPAFAKSAGGILTDKQIDVLVRGIRSWQRRGVLNGVNPPPYVADGPGDSQRGFVAYATYCSACHGSEGRGDKKGSSIVNSSFLALVSDQYLRTTVIVGRHELGAPDWRNDVPGHPMSAQEVSDVVAWLAAQRSRFPGQPYPTSAVNGEK